MVVCVPWLGSAYRDLRDCPGSWVALPLGPCQCPHPDSLQVSAVSGRGGQLG